MLIDPRQLAFVVFILLKLISDLIYTVMSDKLNLSDICYLIYNDGRDGRS